MKDEKELKIDLGGDFGAVALKVNGIRIEVSESGKSVKVISDTPVEVSYTSDGNTSKTSTTFDRMNTLGNTPKTSTAITAAKESLEIGDRMRDGTVVIAIDLKNNVALFAPEGIFGGDTDFDRQDRVIKTVNEQSLHGHKDWRRITDKEAKALAKDWDKVAPPALQGIAAPWFWAASSYEDFGRGYRNGRSHLNDTCHRSDSCPVPVVRSGPAQR